MSDGTLGGMTGEAVVGPPNSGMGAPDNTPGFPFERLAGPAAWLVGLFVAATVLVWRLDITARWEPRYLNVVLQITLVSSISLAVAILAIRSFLRSGNWPVLWLGAASLTYALAIAFSNSLLQWANVNAAVTTHNSSVFVVALLHLLGAFFVYNAIGPMRDSSGRRAAVLEVYAGALTLVVLITVGALLGLTPPFFIQGRGGTPWRQLVVVATALLFLLDGLAFLLEYGRSKASFLYWYALGLLLNCLVMASTLVTAVIGSPLSWLGRLAQIAGGLYLLVATLITLREARARQLPAEDVLASFFWRDEANLRLLFESIMDAIIVTDEHFVITDWNRAAEQIYGWEAKEVIGKPAADAIGLDARGGTDIQKSREELLRIGTWKGQALHRRRDGREIPVLVTVSTIRDATGRVVGTVGVNRDITERVRIEEQLRESEEKTRDLIRYAPTGIYEVDVRTGRFRSINDTMCSVLGYTRDELFAMTAFDLLDDGDKLLFGDRIRRTLAGETIDPTIEYRVLKKDGTAIYIALSTTITYTDGRPDGAFVIAHDVTERRRAAEELRLAAETLERRVQERTAELEASREQMQLLSHRLIEAVEDERRAISRELHDQVGQLLTSLMLGIGVLQKRYPPSDGAARQIAYLQQIGDEVLKSMHDLAVSLRPASLDRVGLAPALNQLTDTFRSHDDLQIDLHTSGLRERLGPKLETGVYRIVQESLTNVARHAQASCVEVTVERHDDRLTVLVKDDGKGFDLEAALRRGRLGLSGMHERVEMLGGELAIETQPGCGTAVHVELPVRSGREGETKR